MLQKFARLVWESVDNVYFPNTVIRVSDKLDTCCFKAEEMAIKLLCFFHKKFKLQEDADYDFDDKTFSRQSFTRLCEDESDQNM
jgi:hypothetical protein